MASVYDLKPKFQSLLRPLLAGLVKLGVTPNMLTAAALALSAAVGAIVFVKRAEPVYLLALPVWLFLRMALNALDGMMAREHNMASHLGAVLNEFGDVLSDLCLYLPLAAVRPDLIWPIVLFCVLGALTEFAGVLTRALGASRRYDGPMGKSDRAFLVGVMGLAAALRPALIGWWAYPLIAANVLLAVTILNRLRAGLGELKGRSAHA